MSNSGPKILIVALAGSLRAPLVQAWETKPWALDAEKIYPAPDWHRSAARL